MLTFGTLVLLPEGAYLGTCKHDWVVSAQKELYHPFFLRERKAEIVFPEASGRLFISMPERRGLLAWIG